MNKKMKMEIERKNVMLNKQTNKITFKKASENNNKKPEKCTKNSLYLYAIQVQRTSTSVTNLPMFTFINRSSAYMPASFSRFLVFLK